MLELLLIPVVIVMVVAAAGLFALLRHFVSAPAHPAPEQAATWVSELSAERYEPMLRLLDESDFRFLRAQPGFTAAMAARVRAQRYRTFLAYLSSMRRDFEAISSVLKFVVVHGDADRRDLASTLLRAQLAFAMGFAMAHLRAYAWRLGYGKVDVREMLKAFYGVQLELQSMIPDAMAA